MVDVAIIAKIVPEEPRFMNEAFSRAGNTFIGNIIESLNTSGVKCSLVLSQRPRRLFPKSKDIWVKQETVLTVGGPRIILIPFINLPILRQITTSIAVAVYLRRWARSSAGQKAVLIVNGIEPPACLSLMAIRFIKATSIGIFLDINIPGETIDAGIRRRIDYWLQTTAIKHFDGLIAVSDSTGKDFAPDIPFLRLEGGVSDELINKFSNILHSNHTEPAHFTMAYAGSLVECNGIKEILRAFSLLKGREYRLNIAGRGPLEPEVIQAVQEDPRICYHGYLDFDGVLQLYAQADVLLNVRLTKRLNTKYLFPWKLFEYLATGKPVISTRIGSVAEEGSSFLFLLDDETPEGLAALIQRVAELSPEERHARGIAGREWVRKYRTWSVQRQKIAQFIKQVTSAQNAN